MTKTDALEYCYKYEKEYKKDCYESGENGEEAFNCLITGIREDIISPDELEDYNMDYD